MEEGDWNVVAGAFFDCWSTSVHVIPNFTPPKSWTRINGFDWGSARPYAYLKAAVSDGVPVSIKPGLQPCFPKGAIICYNELYGAKSANVGLNQDAETVAGILKGFEGGDKPNKRIADPSCWKMDGGPSIHERMSAQPYGLMMFKADNTRIPGWDQVRARLLGNVDPSGISVPMLYFTEACQNTIRTLPALQHDATTPEDVDSDGEDHAADAVRYICMSRPYVRTIAEPSETFRGLTGMTWEELFAWQSRLNTNRGSEKRI